MSRPRAPAGKEKASAPACARSKTDAVPPIVRRALSTPSTTLAPDVLDKVRGKHDFGDVGVFSPRSASSRELVLGAAHDAPEREAREVERPSRSGSGTPDFNRVRVHSGTVASRAAAAIGADAFTVGNDIVFGAGRFAPGSRHGRALLAHELTHVTQQTRGAPANVVRRRNIIEKALIFFGLSEGDFSDTELLDYLKGVTKANKIEDSYDSDNKARAIVRKWTGGVARFRLTAVQMMLLIKEMDSGYVGSEDQTGIFDLLSHAASGDLRIIFGPGGVSPKQLESDFSGDRRKKLVAFYEKRFRGGKAALYAGSIDPLGGPSAGAPPLPWDVAAFEARIENPAYRTDELEAEITALSGAARDTALKELGEQRAALQKQGTETQDKAAAEPDATKKAALMVQGMDLAWRRQRHDAILQPAFRDIALTEAPATLLSKTHAPTAAEKVEIKKALKPELHVSAAGAPLPFAETLVGETKKYGEKITEFMPTMVDSYWHGMVEGKGPVEHADPAKTHKLDEFDSIANAAKDETDAVYGPYEVGSHPAFRSDRPPPVGRGKLHDLFADTEKRLAVMGPAAKSDMAKRLVMYFFQNDSGITAINRKHNADPQFTGDTPVNQEAKILNDVAKAWVADAAHAKKLNEIDRNWDATANPSTHDVNLQIFRKDTPAEDRSFLWDMLQTLIHEYIHTLAHPAYETFANSFGASQENTTLIEGVDSFLTEIVWARTKSRTAVKALRDAVEGAAYSGLPFDASVIPEIFSRRYDSYAQAVRLVNVVGVRNLYAAYFMGRVDLIKGT